MTVGLEIPGAPTVHPRETWQQIGYRMERDFTRLPTLYRPSNVTKMIAHYTGAMNVPDGDPGENPSDIAAWLRRAQADYLTNRTGGGYIRISDSRFFPGYHLGYSFGVDWLGGAWEIRGWDYLPAATNEHNSYTNAVLFYVDGPDQANDLMWETARAIGRETRRRSGRNDFSGQYTDHGTVFLDTGQGTPTACAGAGIRSQLPTEGRLDHNPPGDDMFLAIDPVRILDTRLLGGPALVDQRVVLFPPNRPAWAKGVLANVTVTATEGPGYLTVWGDGPRPATSNINYAGPGVTQANLASTPLAADGSFVLSPAGSNCHLVVDLQAWTT